MFSERPFAYVPLLFLLLAPLVAVERCAAQAASAHKSAEDAALAESVKQLQEQVNELRSVVADLRTESTRYRAETQELREELHSVLARPPQPPEKEAVVKVAAQEGTPAEPDGARQEAKTAEREARLEEQYELLTGKIDDQYQTKVESASKYKLRLSGLVLMDLFSNRGGVLNADVPGLVDIPDPLQRTNSTGFSLRQSQIGLEVFGPEIAGARTHGELQADFAGGFPYAPNGVTFGLLRLRTGTIHLDWAHTSVVAGQDAPFFSALSPTSFATLAEPALAYAGNLWTWIPQVRVEHRVTLSENSSLALQGGLLDGLTGEPPLYSYGRAPQAGEYSRQPGYAGRAGYSHNMFGQAFTFGAGGFYSKQNWGFGRNVNSWASTLDWTAPLGKWLSLSGEFYRGQALGGLGGGTYRSALFSGPAADPTSQVRGLETMGGWSQLKVRATTKLEFNAAAGQDNPFAGELRAFPFAPYGNGSVAASVARNQTGMFNFIYRPRSDLVFSAEYRHTNTYQLDSTRYSADQFNLVMGILF
jgi:regulator of replication initiation timing